MTRLPLRFLLAVTCPALLLSATAAHAQAAPPDKAKLKTAKSYVDAGLAAQNAGDYDTAVELYGKAYLLTQHPVLLFNIAQAHRLAVRPGVAARFYRKFLATKPTGPEARLARELLAEIEKREEEARKATEAEEAHQAKAREDKAREDKAREDKAREDKAREDKAREDKAREDKAREDEARQAETPEARRRPPPRSPEEPRPDLSPWYGDALGDALIVGGTLSLVLGILAYRAAVQDLDTAETAVTRERYLDLVDGAHTKRNIGVVLTGVGLTLTGTGVLRLVLRDRHIDTDASSVVIAPAAGGGLLTFTRSF